MELTVVGCTGRMPGPDVAGVLLPRPARGLALLDLGNGALGALMRYIDIPAIDAICQPPPRGPLPRPRRRCTWRASTAGYGGARRLPVLGPVVTADRMARAYDLPPTGYDRGVRLPRPRGRHRAGPVPDPDRAGRPPGGGLRRPGRRRRPHLVYTGDTGPTDGLVDVAAVPTSRCTRRRSSAATTTRARPAPDRGPGR